VSTVKLRIGIDGKSYDVDVELVEDDTPLRPRGYLPANTPPSTVRSLHAPPAPAAPAADADRAPVNEARVCRSPVAGVVIRVIAQPGQALGQDDLIMVLEAMKMETNVTAPLAGTVKAIRVSEGDGVKVNQVLVEFE
jgi:methylmalonyl-CoA carboxyltransferase small subunit